MMSAEPAGASLLTATGDLMAEGDRSLAAAVLGDSDRGCPAEFCCCCCLVNMSLGSILLRGEISLHDVPGLVSIGDV